MQVGLGAASHQAPLVQVGLHRVAVAHLVEVAVAVERHRLCLASAFKVSDGVNVSAAAYTMTIDVTPVADPTTGEPAISGTAQVATR